MKRITFKELIEEKGDEWIIGIVTRYTSSNVKKTTIAKDEGLSEDMIRRVIAYAIENYLVSDPVVRKIVLKAHGRQVRYSGKDLVTKSDLYYDEILVRRLRTNREKIMSVVRCYINNPDESVDYLSQTMGLSKVAFGTMLKDAILFGVCSDEEMMQIISIAKRKDSSGKGDMKLNLYKEVRRIYRVRTQEIEQLEFRISTYDEYEECGEGESKEELESMRDVRVEELRHIRNNY